MAATAFAGDVYGRGPFLRAYIEERSPPPPRARPEHCQIGREGNDTHFAHELRSGSRFSRNPDRDTDFAKSQVVYVLRAHRY
ncbi:hypothetical protein EVAR_10906_1 [Eumeta japonica]|uniref:Uncharacterized protein n=1 Tax=Eumeta variegata TaxID=151549 RepID=A0A4C1US92_EUMVA|nr:hypothetical protein EVAR_10906_1 [Eumeta japonica]